MDGKPISRAIHLAGTILTAPVSVLVDTGSSYDFLHPRVAKALRLPSTTIEPFRVYVGNGASLLCSHVCRQTELVLQGHAFLVDLHILPIHGANIILGMDWLESLGEVTHNYVYKTMSFVHAGSQVTLQGIIPDNSLATCPPRAVQFAVLQQYRQDSVARRLSANLQMRVGAHRRRHQTSRGKRKNGRDG